MQNTADTDHPVHELIAGRWSPYGYSDRAVSAADLISLFEAARWAPSSYNEQPWAYIVARKDTPDEYEALLSCLVEPNQVWAHAAPVLALGLASMKYAKNGNPNRHAFHDLGQASANLATEATARGLVVHQMGGILPDKVRELYYLPEDWEAVTGIAIGYAADPSTLQDTFKERDLARRPRKPISEFVFARRWGVSARM